MKDWVNSDLLRMAESLEGQAAEIRDEDERDDDKARLMRAAAYLRIAYTELLRIRLGIPYVAVETEDTKKR